MVAKCVTGTRLKSEYDGDQQDLNSIDRQTDREIQPLGNISAIKLDV